MLSKKERKRVEEERKNLVPLAIVVAGKLEKKNVRGNQDKTPRSSSVLAGTIHANL